MQPDVAQRIAELVTADEKIAAIKLLREVTGMGLAEAKAVIESVASGNPLPAGILSKTAEPAAAGDARELPDDVREAALAGRRIEAIRLLRGHSGLGLKDAKDLLDHHLPVPAGKRGCLLPLLFGLLGGALLLR